MSADELNLPTPTIIRVAFVEFLEKQPLECRTPGGQRLHVLIHSGDRLFWRGSRVQDAWFVPQNLAEESGRCLGWNDIMEIGIHLRNRTDNPECPGSIFAPRAKRKIARRPYYDRSWCNYVNISWKAHFLAFKRVESLKLTRAARRYDSRDDVTWTFFLVSSFTWNLRSYFSYFYILIYIYIYIFLLLCSIWIIFVIFSIGKFFHHFTSVIIYLRFVIYLIIIEKVCNRDPSTVSTSTIPQTMNFLLQIIIQKFNPSTKQLF